MLDLSSGTYPFVTSSHCTSGAVAAGLGHRAEGARREPPRDQGVLRPGSETVPFRPSSTTPPASFCASAATSSAPPPGARAARAGSTRSSRAPRSSSPAPTPWRSPSSTASTSSTRSRSASATAWTASRFRICPPLAEDVARLEPVFERCPGWKSTTTGTTRYEDLPPARARLRPRPRGGRRRAGRARLDRPAARGDPIWRPDLPLFGALPPAR